MKRFIYIKTGTISLQKTVIQTTKTTKNEQL